MKTEEITIDGVVYAVRELKYKEAKPILRNENETDVSENFVKLSVSINGAPIGDEVFELSFSNYQLLQGAVNRVHGIESQDQD